MEAYMDGLMDGWINKKKGIVDLAGVIPPHMIV
jgi:hypothetical protein